MESSTSYSTPGNSDDNNDNGEQFDINQNVGENGQEENDEVEDSYNGNVRNPLEMVDIVSLLVKYLDGRSLKCSLMVSKLWNAEGMKFFFKNNFIRISKKLSFESEQKEIEMINKLQTSFSSSTPFPNAFITKPHDIKMLQKYNILAELKHVKVDSKNKNQKNYGMVEIECVEKVLEKCPNLTFLENSEYTSYHVIKKCVETERNGSLTISNVFFKFHRWEEWFQTIEKFVNSGVKIINLLIYDTKVINEDIKIKIPNLIQKMLHSSKDCIKELNVVDCTSSFSFDKNVPVMPQLDSLTVNIKTQPLIPGVPLAFPHGFRFDTNCPNLKRFNILFDTKTVHYGQNFKEALFSSTGPAPSVKYLSVLSFGQIPLDKICETFSEIVNLEINFHWISVSDLKPVWKFCQHLKSLSISLTGFHTSDFIELLAHMTGYSKDYITSVWNSSLPVKISPLVGQPSLLDLQDLETLTVCGYDDDDEEEKSKFLNLLRDFAIPNMPKLKETEWANDFVNVFF